jgi:septum site-determining protein MinD
VEGTNIVITSGKGGVGKTTATASIGAALALTGKKVAVVDMDIGLRNLDVVMGLENRIVFNVIDVIKKKCMLKQASIRDRRVENLYLIPASQSDNKDAVNTQEIIEFAKILRKEFDISLIDCPAGIERGFENSVVAADEAIVICTPEVSSVRDADRVIGLLLARSITPKLLINRIIPKMVAKGDMLSHEDMVEVLSIELLGLVEMDDKVVVATNTGVPLVLQRNSSAGEAYHRIAARLNGQNVPPIQVPRYRRGLFRKFRSFLGFMG